MLAGTSFRWPTGIAGALAGSGYAYVDGVRLDAATALRQEGLEPTVFDGWDALGLVNGTSLTAAAAGLAVASTRRSHTVAFARRRRRSD